MFTPAEAIAELDDALLKAGRNAELFRLSPEISKAVRAMVRGYKPDEIGSGITQGDSLVVISPTSLLGTAFETVLPRKLDQIEFGGRRRNIENADPVLLNDVVVRINLQVRG